MTDAGRAGGLTPESWSRLELLFEQALTRPDHARAAFLDDACGGDAALRREVGALLDAHASTDGPLERLAVELGAGPVDRGVSDWTGRRIGPYTVVREIGHGGMGTVYLARRADGQYDRDVALKVIQSPLDGHQRARFVAERQILARLSHPGIAQLFDGGLTDEGFPYFTMEYVDGERIDRYCDSHELDIASRLRIFGHVCEAVAAAHRSLVVHRDLKPSNILTTADGAIKLVDFGIAKPLDPAVTTDLTRTGGELFTPDYASPEQVSGGAITTASDVYSLGVVLYQLLTGVQAHRFTSKTPADVERAICEGETPSPSSAVAALAAASGRSSDSAPDAVPHDAEQIARVRRTRPDRLKRRLAGDLDTIVMKALHKDPARRYASVDLLQQDITNHLHGLPVAARPDSWTYRTRKFAARHRASVVAGALIVASLAIGLVTTMIEARRAREQQAIAAVERDRARAEAARVKRVSGFVTSLFRQADPSHSQGAVDHRPRDSRSRRAARRGRARRRSRDASGPLRYHRPGLSQPRALRAFRSSAAACAGAAHDDVRARQPRSGREPPQPGDARVRAQQVCGRRGALPRGAGAAARARRGARRDRGDPRAAGRDVERHRQARRGGAVSPRGAGAAAAVGTRHAGDDGDDRHPRADAAPQGRLQGGRGAVSRRRGAGPAAAGGGDAGQGQQRAEPGAPRPPVRPRCARRRADVPGSPEPGSPPVPERSRRRRHLHERVRAGPSRSRQAVGGRGALARGTGHVPEAVRRSAPRNDDQRAVACRNPCGADRS